MTELLQSHDKTRMDEELLFIVEHRIWFLEVKFTPGERAVRILTIAEKI